MSVKVALIWEQARKSDSKDRIEKMKFFFGFQVSSYGLRNCAEEEGGKINFEQRICSKKGAVNVKLLRKDTESFLERARRRRIPI